MRSCALYRGESKTGNVWVAVSDGGGDPGPEANRKRRRKAEYNRPEGHWYGPDESMISERGGDEEETERKTSVT